VLGNSKSGKLETGRLRLWLEFLSLYVLVPLLMATLLPAWWIWPLLTVITLLALYLLRIGGFQWHRLKTGRWIASSRFTIVFVLLTSMISSLLVIELLPGELLAIPRERPWLWLLILLLYPLFSALPQELIFRVLFIERYGVLFPNTGLLLAVNAVCFGLAHVFYGNWVAPVLSAVGGLVFAWAYVCRGSFAYAWVLHSLAGQIIFTSGLGAFFFHAAVGR
jgi:membrane protease YdiL (CAAX protease family)